MIRGLRRGSRRKRTVTVLALIGALLLAVQGIAGLLLGLQMRGRFHTITHDSVPSILAAQNLRAQAQDMDADLANTVLENGNKAFNGEDWVALRRDSAKTTLDQISQAYANVTFAGECQAIRELQHAFLDYDTAAAQVEQLVAQAGGTLGGPAAPPAVTLYGRAADALVGRMDPAVIAPAGQGAAPVLACDANTPPGVSSAGGLFTVNDAHETRAYDAGRSLIAVGIAIALVLGILVLAVVAVANLRLAALLHRRVNAGLAVAAVAAVVVGIFCTVEFAQLNRDFKTVSKDSLDSIRATLRIKAEANQGNADESRWLFDSTNAGRWQDDFFAQRDQVNRDIDAARANITYTGERTAIDGSETPGAADQCQGGLCAAWQSYQKLDGDIRAAQNGGDHAGAIRIDLTTSNDAYGQFITHVNGLQAVNYKVYTDTANSADTRSLVTALVSLLVAIGGAVALLVGVGPRLREI
jgi:hypothetical protein